MIREITLSDFDDLMQLYTQLHNNPLPEKSSEIIKLWNDIVNDKNHHIIIAEENGKIISSCVCIIVPNLTHSQRPYAVIENVITDKFYRKKGFATKCLNFAKEIAISNHCYKIMLMTGAKDTATLKFYENAGYNQYDKTAFIQWL